MFKTNVMGLDSHKYIKIFSNRNFRCDPYL